MFCAECFFPRHARCVRVHFNKILVHTYFCVKSQRRRFITRALDIVCRANLTFPAQKITNCTDAIYSSCTYLTIPSRTDFLIFSDEYFQNRYAFFHPVLRVPLRLKRKRARCNERSIIKNVQKRINEKYFNLQTFN